MKTDVATNSDGLVTIGTGIYFSKPKSTPSPANANPSEGEDANSSSERRDRRVAPPAVILIFGWMGARVSHLVKYVKSYDELYPESAKLVIRSEASFFWSTVAARRRVLQPVVEALGVLGCLPQSKDCSAGVISANIYPVVSDTRPSILVHAFSNGGSAQLATLGDMLESRISLTDTPNFLNCPSVMILDSCPGNGGLNATQRAFSMALRNPIAKALVQLFVRLIYVIMYLQKTILRRPDTLEGMKARLNSANLLPWFGKHTHRLYMYSTKDDLIPYQDVEKHASEAETKGLNVKRVRFEDSAHVAHAKAHPEQYWREVAAIWEEAQ